MSAGLIAVLVIAAVLLGVALGLIWWVNRPIKSDHAYARQTLPLFGSDAVIDAAPIDDEELEGDNTLAAGAGNIVPSVPQPNAADIAAALGASDASPERRALRFAPPPGAVPVSSMEAPRPPERKKAPEMPRTFTTAPSTSRTFTTARDPDVVARPTAATSGSSAIQMATPADNPQFTPPVSRVSDAPEGSTYEGQLLRFSIPADGTLQFLPGRLEITAGQDIGREIRFVRFPGPNGSRVTFGRVEGPMYRHVQLHDQTVSRRHATMQLDGSSWILTNLSTTNPVVHNDRVLGEGEVQSLADGDRIEMGEVVFRYRVR